MKNLPLGIQTFSEIIGENLLYVDKTKEIFQLITDGKYYFLSRPRRFGKSLLISTLEEIFLGNKELFKNLWIYDKIEWKKYPVIRIDFTAISYTEGVEGFKISFFNLIKSIANSYNLKLENTLYKEAFKELLIKLSKTEKVVLLIDEYDKPIINFVDKVDIARENRDILKNFYETIKACDQYIQFAFLTGISKFSKVSVFSGLNNLRDITLDDSFSTITGYTEEELFSYFDKYIKKLAKKFEITEQILKNEIKRWYNGYSWNGKNFVYNPFSILYMFTKQEIENYWFETATPSFLIKKIREYNIDVRSFEKCNLAKEDFSSYEVDDMNVYALLFQTGYLTIKEIIIDGFQKEYILSYPNKEVKDSLLKYLLNDFVGKRLTDNISIREMVKKLKSQDLDGFFMILKSVFGTIPNQIFPDKKVSLYDREFYYHTIFYLIFKLIGLNINSEVSVNKGRIDAITETETSIYIFEFKLKSSNKALKQIETKKYYEKYLSSNKEVFLIGVSFDTKERNISSWKAKELL